MARPAASRARFARVILVLTLLLPAPALARRPVPLHRKQAYTKALDGALRALGRGGGLVRLKPNLRTLVLPDIHARVDYLPKVLRRKDPKTGKTYRTLLRRGELQIVLLGDAMHAEGRAAKRWEAAAREPQGKAMRREAAESLGAMKAIFELKAAFPQHVHYLKGNHDNILDQRRAGDWPVHKYADESALLRGYLEKQFGRDFLARWHEVERKLPLVAVGPGFALSHSGPGGVVEKRAIARRQAKAVESFTWTDLTANSPKQARLARAQLAELGVPEGFFLAGHRPAAFVRRQGAFYQFNHESKLLYAVLEPHTSFRPRRDVVDAARPAGQR